MSKRESLFRKREALTITAAKKIIEWYQKPSDDSAVLNSLLSQETREAAFHVRGGVNSPLVFKRHFASIDFPHVRASMVANWAGKLETLTLNEAEAFFREFAECIDHDFLFGQGVSVGLTRASRLFPASDYITAYHAQRTPWTLHLTVRGAADYIADTVIRSSPSELLLIAPNASLHYKRSESVPNWKHFWAIFQPRADWFELMDWQMVTYGIYRLKITSKHNLDSIRALLDEMVNLYAQPTPMMERLVENLFEQLLLRAANCSGEIGSRPTDVRVLKACKYIETHYAKQLSVSDIASHCNVSESRLAHLFKHNLGQSVNSFRDAVRVQRAQRLLATTTLSVTTVGKQVGYDDPAQFSKFFRRKLKSSPKAFRQQFSKS